MDIQKEEAQRVDFRHILFDLAKSQIFLGDSAERFKFFKRLENLYYTPNKNDEFRHYYSDIFAVLIQIQQDSNLGDINILGQNLEVIRKNYFPKNCDRDGNLIDISDKIRKLYDHVNLDIARIVYSDAGDWELSQSENLKIIHNEILDVQNKIEEAQIKIDIAKEDIDCEVNSVKEKVQNTQREYTTILSIFAAVILAFTGGMVFSSSVLENINKASIYRMCIISLIIGIVFFNIIWVLIDFIRDINGKYVKKVWLWFLINSILIAGIAFTCYSYKQNWFSKEQIITYEINQCHNSQENT